MLPTGTEIEYFIEVYQTRHISKAAIRLGVTQPTVTLSLQKLEEKLETKVFHRTKQGVVPTEQGSLFYRKALILLDCWGEVQKGIQKSTSEIFGRFKVGCHQSVGAYTLPHFLEQLRKNAPAIEIELMHDFSRKITEGVVSYNIDIGFVVNPSRHPDLVLKKLGDDKVLFWKKRGAIDLPERIFADVNLAQMQDILGKTQAKEFKGWNIVSTPSLELIRTLTLCGQGIGILPERVAKADGADLVPFDPNLPTYEDKIFLAYRKDVLSSKAGRELVRLASFPL
ncbi:MAG: LysR family transcriptional regulator [Cryobacterium sp.]|nr:LysR family transcriptional regulator [Oligoflexia bacterium]